MKKINFKHRLLLVGMVVLLFASCEEAEQEFDIIQETVERGAILRTVNIISDELPVNDTDGSFSVELEVQDQENGALVDNVEVYIAFDDTTEDVGPGTDVAEALSETISSSTFTTGEAGLPRFTYTITLAELLTFVGRSNADIAADDEFIVRFELVLSDGRRYSEADNSGNLTGSYFSSPFQYEPTVVDE